MRRRESEKCAVRGRVCRGARLQRRRGRHLRPDARPRGAQLGPPRGGSNRGGAVDDLGDERHVGLDHLPRRAGDGGLEGHRGGGRPAHQRPGAGRPPPRGALRRPPAAPRGPLPGRQVHAPDPAPGHARLRQRPGRGALPRAAAPLPRPGHGPPPTGPKARRLVGRGRPEPRPRQARARSLGQGARVFRGHRRIGPRRQGAAPAGLDSGRHGKLRPIVRPRGGPRGPPPAPPPTSTGPGRPRPKRRRPRRLGANGGRGAAVRRHDGRRGSPRVSPRAAGGGRRGG
mmetsp:Transcript_4687/g.11019  ORF Transcript_4687/g.11019 Transcript_4687/m.11019 type:complete len:285 (+) Transcript_4687:373-1227(+)